MIFDDLLQLTAKCQQLRQSESARNSALNQTVLKVVPYHFYFHIFHTYFFIIFFHLTFEKVPPTFEVVIMCLP